MIETAYAKINLALHVRRRREDGYHELETAFAFVDDGDRLTASPAARDVVHVKGEFAGALDNPFDNIVAKALTSSSTSPAGWSRSKSGCRSPPGLAAVPPMPGRSSAWSSAGAACPTTGRRARRGSAPMCRPACAARPASGAAPEPSLRRWTTIWPARRCCWSIRACRWRPGRCSRLGTAWIAGRCRRAARARSRWRGATIWRRRPCRFARRSPMCWRALRATAAAAGAHVGLGRDLFRALRQRRCAGTRRWHRWRSAHPDWWTMAGKLR